MNWKHQVNWNTVCGAVQDLPWRNIWSTDNPIEVLNEHLLLLVGRFVPTKVIRVLNKDKPWFDDQCRHAFGLKQEAHLRWTRDRSRVNLEEFVHCQVRANETYSEARRRFSARNRDILMNAQSPYKWWPLWNFSSRNRVTPVSIQDGVWHGITFAAISTTPTLPSRFLRSYRRSLRACGVVTIRDAIGGRRCGDADRCAAC